jgi:hypothetical protein
VSERIIRPWVVEVRCPDPSYRDQLHVLWRELDHLPRELFDTTHAIGLRVDIMAADEAEAITYVEKRITASQRRGWVNGVDYTLKAVPRRL